MADSQDQGSDSAAQDDAGQAPAANPEENWVHTTSRAADPEAALQLRRLLMAVAKANGTMAAGAVSPMGIVAPDVLGTLMTNKFEIQSLLKTGGNEAVYQGVDELFEAADPKFQDIDSRLFNHEITWLTVMTNGAGMHAVASKLAEAGLVIFDLFARGKWHGTAESAYEIRRLQARMDQSPCGHCLTACRCHNNRHQWSDATVLQ